MKTRLKKLFASRQAFSFPEMVMAIAVFAFLAIPLYQSMHNVQTDTYSSINYFRAMEMANEAIEYVKLLPMDKNFINKAESLSGSILVENADASLSPAKIATGDNPYYHNILASNIQYSEQYNKPCFYRTVEVATLHGTSYAKLLKKVIVTVYWDNKAAVTNLHSVSGRSKKVVLACLITDWESQP